MTFALFDGVLPTVRAVIKRRQPRPRGTGNADTSRPCLGETGAARRVLDPGLQDGVWHQGEFALWSRPGYVGDIDDTRTRYHKTYYGRNYVNSAITFYNTASSTANGNKVYRVIATNYPEGKGDRLKHLKYPACNNVTCYAYMTGRVDRYEGQPVPEGGCNGEAMRELGAELPKTAREGAAVPQARRTRL